MTDIPRLVSAEPVLHGILKIKWADGYEGIVDLRPVLGRGGIFSFLDVPGHFDALSIGENGHALIWIDDQGREIDIGSDSLRRRAETQTELHRLAG